MTHRLTYSKGPRVFHDDTERGPRFPARQRELVVRRGGIDYHRLDVATRLGERRWPGRALLHLKKVAVEDTVVRSPQFLSDGDHGAHAYLLALEPEPDRRPRIVGLLVLDLRPAWTCTYDIGERRVTSPAVRAPAGSTGADFVWVPSSRRRTGVATALLRIARSDRCPLLLHRSFTHTSTGFACSVFGQQIPIFHRDASQVSHPRSPYIPEPPNEEARD